ncbi:MAG: hypothetical protein JO100_18950 [Pseudonocardia sp.]|nr:hypothetical protein [Pseudonocardia sp.]
MIHIVDVTSRRHAPELVTAVKHRGLTATEGDERDLAYASDGLMLVLPAELDTHPKQPEELLFRIERLATQPRRRDEPRARLVVVWSVRRRDRPVLATPHDGLDETRDGRRRGGWNAAALFLGETWRREYTHHRGDEGAAARCLSNRIETLFAAGSHQHLAGAVAADVCADLRALDPLVLHTLYVERSVRPTRPQPSWAGHAAAAAAMAVRIAADQTRRLACR